MNQFHFKHVLWLLLAVVLVACSTAPPTPFRTASPDSPSLGRGNSTEAPAPSQSPAVAATTRPTPALTATLVIPEFPTKEVILAYTAWGGGLGSPDFLLDGFFVSYHDGMSLLLYSDGQLILQPYLSPIVTKFLSQAEIDQLFSRLDTEGFFTIETNQQHDETDHLYDFGGHFQRVHDGLVTHCLTADATTERTICINENYAAFANPTMKNLFRFVENYSPDGLTAYEPDRLVLFASRGRDILRCCTDQDLQSIPWPTDLPSLETPDEKFLYLEGDAAAEAFALEDGSQGFNVFNENGQDYSVVMAVVFPHEVLTEP